MVPFPKYTQGMLRGMYIAPKGILATDFKGLQKLGCIQCETDQLEEMFVDLYYLSNCNPCEGCPIWEEAGPNCRAFQKYHSAYQSAIKTRANRIEKATSPPPIPGSNCSGLTIKQIATKLGISKNEVRRRKTAGTLWADVHKKEVSTM